MIKFIKNCPALDLDLVSSEVLKYYLIDGLSLTRIEDILLNDSSLRGWFSKSILNFYGIDTSVESKNRGSYKGKTANVLISELKNSSNYLERRIADKFSRGKL